MSTTQCTAAVHKLTDVAKVVKKTPYVGSRSSNSPAIEKNNLIYKVSVCHGKKVLSLELKTANEPLSIM